MFFEDAIDSVKHLLDGIDILGATCARETDRAAICEEFEYREDDSGSSGGCEVGWGTVEFIVREKILGWACDAVKTAYELNRKQEEELDLEMKASLERRKLIQDQHEQQLKQLQLLQKQRQNRRYMDWEEKGPDQLVIPPLALPTEHKSKQAIEHNSFILGCQLGCLYHLQGDGYGLSQQLLESFLEHSASVCQSRLRQRAATSLAFLLHEKGYSVRAKTLMEQCFAETR
jgi:hypothetical protein